MNSLSSFYADFFVDLKNPDHLLVNWMKPLVSKFEQMPHSNGAPQIVAEDRKILAEEYTTCVSDYAKRLEAKPNANFSKMQRICTMIESLWIDYSLIMVFDDNFLRPNKIQYGQALVPLVMAAERIVEKIQSKNSLPPVEMDELYHYFIELNTHTAMAFNVEGRRCEADDFADNVLDVMERVKEPSNRMLCLSHIVRVNKDGSNYSDAIKVMKFVLSVNKFDHGVLTNCHTMMQKILLSQQNHFAIDCQKTIIPYLEKAFICASSTNKKEIEFSLQLARSNLDTLCDKHYRSFKAMDSTERRVLVSRDKDAVSIATSLHTIPEKICRIIIATLRKILYRNGQIFLTPICSLKTPESSALPIYIGKRIIRILNKVENLETLKNEALRRQKDEEMQNIMLLEAEIKKMALSDVKNIEPQSSMPSVPDSVEAIAPVAPKKDGLSQPKIAQLTSSIAIPSPYFLPTELCDAKRYGFSTKIFGENEFRECRTRGGRNKSIFVVYDKNKEETGPTHEEEREFLNRFEQPKIVPFYCEIGFKWEEKVLCLKNKTHWRLVPIAVQRNMNGQMAFLYGKFYNSKTGLGEKHFSDFIKKNCIDYGTRGDEGKAI